MGVIASQITSLTIVYSTVYSDADQRKHQSSTSLAFVRGIHWGPVNSPHKWPVTRKMFPFDDVIMFMLVTAVCIFYGIYFNMGYIVSSTAPSNPSCKSCWYCHNSNFRLPQALWQTANYISLYKGKVHEKYWHHWWIEFIRLKRTWWQGTSR